MDFCKNLEMAQDILPLAIATVPMQPWEYAKEFEPLTQDCICPDTNNQTETFTKYPGQKHFTWSDGPLPWEGGIV